MENEQRREHNHHCHNSCLKCKHFEQMIKKIIENDVLEIIKKYIGEGGIPVINATANATTLSPGSQATASVITTQ